jgi:hypothetical protein
MAQSPEHAMHNYAEAYEKLYNRRPRDLRAIDGNWVIVNGARIRVTELEHLTQQLLSEYKQTVGQRRSIVKRLITWFKN